MDPEPLQTVLADAQRIGLLGPEPVERHIEHTDAWADALLPMPFLDLGSGGGVPGLALAIRWPDVEGTLLDSQVRRAGWLRTAIARLGLVGRVTVLEGRAEDLAHEPAHREAHALVVARGFGPPAATAECGSGFITVGGILSVSGPPSGDADRWSVRGLTEVGLEISTQVVQPSGSFVILRKRVSLEDRFPRRRNLPVKSPLWS